jgi:hypothetical protein
MKTIDSIPGFVNENSGDFLLKNINRNEKNERGQEKQF